MSYLINNQQKLNDVIFADRNKEYGAYVIRSSYGNTIFKSLSFMFIGVGSMVSLALFLTNRNNLEPEKNNTLIIHDSVYIIPVTIPHEDPPVGIDRSDPPPAGDTHPTESGRVVVIDATVAITESLTIETPVVTNTNTVGNGTNAIVSPSLTTGGGGGGTDTSTAIAEPFLVDTPPEFEGGPAALRRFISEHLKYPGWASGEGKEGTVYVKFVVDENCKVGSLSLLNSVGYGMDDEAMRVVSLIPKFKSPAKIKGVPVKAYYQIPIRFRFKY